MNNDQAMTNVLIENARDQVNNIFNSLIVEKTNSVLPENIFRDYFLPFFAGIRPFERNSPVISEWISIAGTPMSEVDIIDGAGRVLYTVPSLFDTDFLSIARRDPGDSIADIYQQYDLRSNNLPQVANNYLNKALNTKLSKIKLTSNRANENLNRWNTILTRYGLNAVNSTVVNRHHNEDLTDDLIY